MNKVAILSTGEELLSGRVIDTNAAFISNELSKWDVNISRHVTLGDDKKSLDEGLRSSLADSDIVIITGGLGPTDDDNTVEVISHLLNKTIITDIDSLNKMTSYFSERGLEVNDYDKKMAFYPEGATIIPNRLGLAPGFIIEHNRSILIALPGVPGEMRPMLTDTVVPYIRDTLNLKERKTFIIKISGVKEADVNHAVTKILGDKSSFKWGITTKDGLVTLSFKNDEGDYPEFEFIRSKLKKIFMDKMLKDGFSYPHEELVAFLIEKNITIAVAESCTGGLISKYLTDIPGSSQVFMGAVTAYSNKSKVTLLNVPAHIIEEHGAVSEEVARSMARGVQNLFDVSLGLSTTGIAGPGGGTELKPVGTVCFGFAIKDEIFSVKQQFYGNRQTVRQRSSAFALDYIRRKILKLL